MEIRKTFGPHMAPGLKIFWPEDSAYNKVAVGMEAMAFDINNPSIAQAGLVSSDPLDPATTHRLDGALESELRRMGIYITEVKNHEWRAWYEVKAMPKMPPPEAWDQAMKPGEEK
jgi:hypothetical protein